MKRPIAAAFRLLLALAALACAGALPARAAETPAPLNVALKQRAVVEGEVVRLGALFHGLGAPADTVIARAPEPGETIELNARWLAALAQGYRLPWSPDSRLTRIVLERATRVIDAERISALIVERIFEQGEAGDISVVLDNPGIQLQLPSEIEPSLRLVGFVHDPGNGRFRGQVVAPAKGSPVLTTFVSGRALEMRQVPVLRRQVAPGETIGKDDVGWSRERADRLARNAVIALEDVVGLSPRRPITAGRPLRSDELRAPVVVAKNSLVVIKLQSNRMLLTAQARALEDGARGDLIRVMNTKSKTVINAVVVDTGSVTVPNAALTAAR